MNNLINNSSTDYLFFASMCQVYPADRGINFAVKLGREVSIKLIKDEHK